MTKFKICGLRQPEHAIAAAESGADFLGFNFVEGVRRQLQVEQGKAVIQEYRRGCSGDGPELVGLFANQPLEFVNQVIESCGLDFAQLCGDEPPEFWSGVNAGVIRQVKVRDEGPRENVIENVLASVDEVVSQGHMAMLDKHEAGALGGTGRAFDWSIAREVAKRFDIFLAGGLSPENVGEAISMARPWGVDVSSGVEIDGVKDVERINSFAAQVRSAKVI